MKAPLARAVAVVQFPHPGREWSPDRGTSDRRWTDWDDGHGRKFLRHPGRYVDDAGNEVGAQLTFWAEWEGPSTCSPTHATGAYAPVWFQVPNRGDLDAVPRPQNTDPFVFGEFLYSNCMQDHEWPKGSQTYAPTAMSSLAPGSVILFGSTQTHDGSRVRDFVMDTCFVVGSVVDIDETTSMDQIAGRVPAAFGDATLKPVFLGVRRRRLSLYFGASFGSPSNSTFSFFPCLPATSEPIAFNRPTIRPVGALEDFVNPLSSRRFRRKPCDLEAAGAAWSEVRRQVEDAGFRLGVRAEPL
jgi:hypothetical protein